MARKHPEKITPRRHSHPGEIECIEPDITIECSVRKLPGRKFQGECFGAVGNGHCRTGAFPVPFPFSIGGGDGLRGSGFWYQFTSMDLSNFENMDPHLLVGLVNTELRNNAESLDDLVKTHGISEERLLAKLAGAGYDYMEGQRQFR